jgi:uncharacterized protein (DUF302 family)
MKQDLSNGWNVGSPAYTKNTRVRGASFDAVVQKVREELQKEGFGVLTEIDLQATMKKKLDIDVPRYLILGACNPPLAHQAVSAEPGIGALLPCNVMVAEEQDGIFVGAIDPAAMFSVVNRQDVLPVADEVGTRLDRVMKGVGG